MLTSRQITNLAHILVLGPLLLGIGFGYIPPSQYIVGLGIGVLIYHIFMTLRSGFNWMRAIHVLAVAPALIYFGYTGDGHARDACTLLGGAAVAYHTARLLQ